MDIVVVGSVALDTIKTPFGEVNDILGGSAVYFSNTASYFSKVNVVGVVGNDFPEDHLEYLRKRDVDLEGLKKVDGETFRWTGKYEGTMNEAHTLDTKLNVFAEFSPEIPEQYREMPYLFLANIDPELQLKVMDQMKNTRLVICDTMNFWISSKPDTVKEVLKRVNILLINDGEARQLTGETNLIRAGKQILQMGPSTVVIKKGEHGAILINRNFFFSAPAFPLEKVCDPTGAGDSFAGGFVGSLAKNGKYGNEEYGLKRAMIYGSVVASFTVEDFSLNRYKLINAEEIEYRYQEMISFTHFEDLI